MESNTTIESKQELRVLFVLEIEPPKSFSEAMQGIFSPVFLTTDNLQQAENELATGGFFLTVSDNLQWLIQVKNRFPDVQRVWLDQGLSIATLENVVNSRMAHYVISTKQGVPEVFETLKKTYVQYQEKISNKSLLSDIARQNKELESLNKDLESIVEERTYHIKVSEADEREKINRIRALIRFIKNLTSLDSFEEILNSLRNEIKKFHGLSDPMLYFKTQDHEYQLVYFRAGRAYFSRFSEELKLSEGTILSSSLANILGRPMGKVMAFTLKSSDKEDVSATFTLMIEHQLEETDRHLFVDFMEERKQALRLALERVLFEQSLSGSIYRWERTFDGIRDPISIIDSSYQLLRVNKSFSPRVNHKKCYANWNRVTEGESGICEGCPVAKTMKTGKPQVSQVKRGDRLYSVFSYPIRLSTNELVSNIVNHYVDMTESQELYSRMIQSEKMGALGLLAGNIAHELNNPLTGIRSLAQVLANEQAEGSPLQSDLKEIEKGARRSQEIIKNLLDFSQGQTEVSDVVLDELVQKTLPMLKSAMSNHRSEVFLEGGKSLIRVHGHLIQQVIFNLVNNACQAMQSQGLLILKTQPAYYEGQRGVKLIVKDNGPGIPENQQAKIFEPFFTTKKDGLGTGLGLSMAKSIIESFQGKIGVESMSGQGAEFWIWLPLIS